MEENHTGDDVSRERSRRQFVVATGVAGAVALAGCAGGGAGGGGTDESDGSEDGGSMDDGTTTGEGGSMDDSMDGGTATGEGGSMDDSMDDGTATETDTSGESSWQSVELTTVRGDETFTLSGLDGPVIVQSFAVWCPKCQRQSEQLAKLDDSVTVVGLNTDPNEDAAKVRAHAKENGFDWRFAVAPTEMTGSLVEEFGPTVTNAPSTPIIVLCGDGSASFMSGSIMSAGELSTAADEC